MIDTIATLVAWVSVGFFVVGTIGGWIVLYFVGRDFYSDMQTKRIMARHPRYVSPDPDYSDEHETR